MYVMKTNEMNENLMKHNDATFQVRYMYFPNFAAESR